MSDTPSRHLLTHRTAQASAKDIDLAVAAAREAFNTTWGKNVTGWERSRLINKLADLIERDAQELGELESLNNGKPVKIARYRQLYKTEPHVLIISVPTEILTLATASSACVTTQVSRTRLLGRYEHYYVMIYTATKIISRQLKSTIEQSSHLRVMSLSACVAKCSVLTNSFTCSSDALP